MKWPALAPFTIVQVGRRGLTRKSWDKSQVVSHADVAQLVEHLVANEKAAGSYPVICSKSPDWGISDHGTNAISGH